MGVGSFVGFLDRPTEVAVFGVANLTLPEVDEMDLQFSVFEGFTPLLLTVISSLVLTKGHCKQLDA